MRKRFFLLLFSLPLPVVWGQQQDTIVKRDSIAPTETVYDLEEVLFFGSLCSGMKKIGRNMSYCDTE